MSHRTLVASRCSYTTSSSPASTASLKERYSDGSLVDQQLHAGPHLHSVALADVCVLALYGFDTYTCMPWYALGDHLRVRPRHLSPSGVARSLSL